MERVRENLENLKETIESSDDLTKFRPAVELLEEINPILGGPGEISFDHHRNLLHSLEDAVIKFGVEHPKLVGDIKVIVNSLNDIGI